MVERVTRLPHFIYGGQELEEFYWSPICAQSPSLLTFNILSRSNQRLGKILLLLRWRPILINRLKPNLGPTATNQELKPNNP